MPRIETKVEIVDDLLTTGHATEGLRYALRQFDEELFLEMRGWQARRLSHIVEVVVVPLMRRRYQERKQQEPE